MSCIRKPEVAHLRHGQLALRAARWRAVPGVGGTTALQGGELICNLHLHITHAWVVCAVPRLGQKALRCWAYALLLIAVRALSYCLCPAISFGVVTMSSRHPCLEASMYLEPLVLAIGALAERTSPAAGLLAAPV